MALDLASYTATLPRDHLATRMPPEEYTSRIERLRKFMEENHYDIAVAFGSESRPGDVGWLTGYDPHIETCMVAVGKDKTFIIGGPSFIRYAREMSPSAEYRLCFDFSIQEEYESLEFFSLGELLTEAAGGAVRRIAVLTTPDILPVKFLQAIEDTSAEVVNASSWLLEARYWKSQMELEMFHVASRIATTGLKAALAVLEPGKRETEVAATAEYVMKSLGADRFTFNTVMMSGRRISMVGARASNKVIEEGDLVTISPGARYEGISSTVGRTVVAGGKPSPTQLELLEHGTKAYKEAIPHFRYGEVAKHVDLAARNYLKSVGLLPFYSNVHNVGWTECMEGYGGADSHSEWTYPKGVSLMVDVGFFGLPYKDLPAESVGFRLEDPWCINHGGEPERLTDLPHRVWELVPKS